MKNPAGLRRDSWVCSALSALAGGTPAIPPSNQEDEAENADYKRDKRLARGEPLRRVETNRSVHVSGDPTSRVNPHSPHPSPPPAMAGNRITTSSAPTFVSKLCWSRMS